MQFSFCSTSFLPGVLLEKKASVACTQSGTTSPSLPGHPILCIPSYQDTHLAASYTEELSLGLLVARISCPTAWVLELFMWHQYIEKNGSTGSMCYPTGETTFQVSIFMEVTLHCSQTLTSRLTHLSVTPQGNANKPCAVGCSAPYNGQMYLAWLGLRLFLIH